ncbi:MAG: aminomethyl transferase family protein [Pseudomonadota bacterium]
MKPQRMSLAQAIERSGGPLGLLRSPRQVGAFAFPRLPPEFSNWRDEQRAWRHGVALLELSFHQADLYIRGPQAIELIRRVSANRTGNFPVNRAKQIIACSPDGYQIGDGICLQLEEDYFRIAGPTIVVNWTQFVAQSGGFDVEIERHESMAMRQGDPEIFIYQIQGPEALATVQGAADGELPEIGFFGIGAFTIAGKAVRALRHGMAGSPGFEIFGPWEDAMAVKDALEKAGAPHGMRKVGGLAYATTAAESGWVPLPLPAIYSGEAMKPYQDWLMLPGVEGMGSLGGSFRSEAIEDYYTVPGEFGSARLIDFDEDFIGREALKERIANTERTKMTLVWNAEDVSRVQHQALMGDGVPAKYISQPLSHYCTFPYDEVVSGSAHAGISMFAAYSSNARAFLSLALLKHGHAVPGTELTLRWGDPTAGRPGVEEHKMAEIRVTVAPAPFFDKSIKQD